MIFSEQLDKFVEHGSSKYIDKRIGHFSIYDELPISSIEDIAEESYKECSYSIKPIVLKIYEAIEWYANPVNMTCSTNECCETAEKALAEVEKIIGGENDGNK